MKKLLNNILLGNTKMLKKPAIRKLRLTIAHAFLITFSFVPLTALAEQAPPPPQAIQTSVPQGPISTPDDQAHFLAGMAVPGQSPLYPRANSRTYLQHISDFKRDWQTYQRSYFDKQRSWAEGQVNSKIPVSNVVYYPFSGPDFINAFAYFPNADTYILIGREPIGSVAPPERLSDDQIANGLDNLRNTMSTILRFSFFITKDMRASMERSEFRGVLPVLYTFLAASGHRITDVQQTTAGGDRAIRIQFTRNGSNKTLYYVQGDLSNGGSKSLIAWMSSFPTGVGFIKSCSYLLHSDAFSQIRQFLLQHCNAILQDDSGIPYRYFTSNQWNVYLFGNYTRPIAIFSSKYQADLHQAYNTPGVAQRLPFGTGYNWRPGQSNMLLAVKKAQ